MTIYALGTSQQTKYIIQKKLHDSFLSHKEYWVYGANPIFFRQIGTLWIPTYIFYYI